MTTQGKCQKCKRAFRFKYPKRLRDAYCPHDGNKLVSTTHLYRQGEWEKRDALDSSQAYRLREARL